MKTSRKPNVPDLCKRERADGGGGGCMGRFKMSLLDRVCLSLLDRVCLILKPYARIKGGGGGGGVRTPTPL